MKPIDARSLPDAETLRATVCIVGGGAAGISVAHELAGSDIDVLLLEAGGQELEPATQDLYRGENRGHPYFPLESCRLRFFGGTTNHWAGVCREMDPIDFEPREEIPHSGWPISRGDLDGYYERARKLCQLGPEIPNMGGHAFESPLLETQAIYFSPPTRFGTAYGEMLEAAPNIRSVMNANAVEVVPARDAERVERIRFKTTTGTQFTVEARIFVLALGGLETPRLMLASREVHGAGVGNQNDLVGRFFMEHPHAFIGKWMLGSGATHDPIYDWPNPNHGYAGASMGLVTMTDRALRKDGLVGWSAELRLTSPSQDSPGFEALRKIARKLRRLETDGITEHVRTVIDDLDGVTGGLWQYATGDLSDSFYEMRLRSEQVPNPDSRVMLGDELDPLGMPRIALDWQLDEIDVRSLHRGLEILGTEVGRLGWGRLQFPEADDPEWRESIHGGWHHMGTTRMADDPNQGVVDRHCRVHGLPNLYVAGSSVFTTGGWSNPTLTLVALAARTADHIRSELATAGGPTPS